MLKPTPSSTQPSRVNTSNVSFKLGWRIYTLRKQIGVTGEITPIKLMTLLITGILGAILLALAAYNTYADLRYMAKTIGQDTVVSIVAAQQIRATLADANSNVINAFLSREADTGVSWKTYESEINQVQANLLLAAENITYGDDERKPILTMMSRLSEYERMVGDVRGRTGDTALQTLLKANRLMRESILPAGEALNNANFSRLDQIYWAHRASIVSKIVFFIFSGLILLAVLIYTQFYLFRRTNRIVNIGLACATLVSAVFLLYGLRVFNVAEAELTAAKQDAFDSIQALWKMRATANDANTDESLYLLYRGQTALQTVAQNDFRAKTSQIVDIDPPTALNKANTNQKFGGMLGAIMSNITFAGERDAALKIVGSWAEYMKIDAQMRALEQANKPQEALALNTGRAPGQSNWAFDQFDNALGRTIEINRVEFDDKMNRVYVMLNFFPYMLAFCWLSIVIASVLGMKPRLDEYRF